MFNHHHVSERLTKRFGKDPTSHVNSCQDPKDLQKLEKEKVDEKDKIILAGNEFPKETDSFLYFRDIDAFKGEYKPLGSGPGYCKTIPREVFKSPVKGNEYCIRYDPTYERGHWVLEYNKVVYYKKRVTKGQMKKDKEAAGTVLLPPEDLWLTAFGDEKGEPCNLFVFEWNSETAKEFFQ